jgi:CRISPR-associated protein Cmr6
VQLQNKYPYYDLTFNNYTKDKTISLIMDAHKGFISRDPLQYSKDLYKKNIFKITNNPEIKNQLKTLKETREQMMKSMKTQGYKTITIEAKLDSPMLVGIGNPSIDEIGFYWNRNYSVPTVPGSSIKGAFRNYWKTEKLDGSIEKIIFGSDDNNNSSRGEVVFMEAIPVDKFDLMQEFQTPHFGDYYSSNKVPNDVHNPVPLNFISVKEGSTYRFDFLTKNPDENIAKEIEKHFKIILEYIGIGSKTSMGYGRFRNIENKQ